MKKDKPFVTMKFVERWNSKLAVKAPLYIVQTIGENSLNVEEITEGLVYVGTEGLIAMLTEAGIRIKENKNEKN